MQIFSAAAPQGIVLDAPEWLLMGYAICLALLIIHRAIYRFKAIRSKGAIPEGNASLVFHKTPLIWIFGIAFVQMLGNFYLLGAIVIVIFAIFAEVLDLCVFSKRITKHVG